MRQGRQAGAGTVEDLAEALLSRTGGAAGVHGMGQGHAVGLVPDEGTGAGLSGGRQRVQAGPGSIPSLSQGLASGAPLS